MNNIFFAMSKRDVWLYLALLDIRLRYRRSALGPFWITISMAIFSVSIGIVYSQLFNARMETYLPYLTLNVVLWNLIASSLNESTLLYVENSAYIKDLNINLEIITLRALSRQVIIFAHNCLVIVGVFVFYSMPVNWSLLLSIIGLLLLFLFLLPMAACISLLGARYRDISQIVTNLLQVLFFVTPLTWETKLLDNKQWIYIYNPLYHFIEIVRAPWLGYNAAWNSWLICILCVIFAFFTQAVLFKRKSDKIAYWV